MYDGRYVPRSQFMPYHMRTERWAKLVAHRRAGKTVACLNDLIAHAAVNPRKVPQPPRYAYVAPTFTEGKDRAWGYLKHYVGPIARESSESELWIELDNGARIRIYGADNIHRMRGIYLDGIVADEPSQMHPDAWPLIMRPTLADFEGWATFIGTPSGRDWFHNVDRDAEDRPLPGWFRLTLKASQTGLLAPDELESMRGQMSPEQFEQELECSFEAAIRGAYYGRALAEAEKQGRICRLSPDPVLPVRAYFDIGYAGRSSDAEAIWIVQFVGQEIKLLEYIEGLSQPIGYYTHLMRTKGWQNAVCIFPHDGVKADAHAIRYCDHWRQAGFECREPVPNMGPGAAMVRIEAARRLFPKMWFNDKPTEGGRKALAAYHEKWDAHRRIGLGPEHDWSSHCADAFGLMAVDYKEPNANANFWRPLKYKRRGIA